MQKQSETLSQEVKPCEDGSSQRSQIAAGCALTRFASGNLSSVRSVAKWRRVSGDGEVLTHGRQTHDSQSEMSCKAVTIHRPPFSAPAPHATHRHNTRKRTHTHKRSQIPWMCKHKADVGRQRFTLTHIITGVFLCKIFILRNEMYF